MYQIVLESEEVAESSNKPFHEKKILESPSVLALWKQQFVDALMVMDLVLYFRIL